MKKLLVILFVIAGLIYIWPRPHKEYQPQVKARVQVETSKEVEPDAKIVEAWFIACEKAAEYKLVGDSKNYLKWKREARRLAILLGY